MKTTINKPVEVNIRWVNITVPVRYEDEDIPYDFPLRSNDVWRATVDIDTGRINDWPEGKSGRLQMKVTDCGVYTLRDEDNQVVAEIEQGYVPHGVVPGSFGDYIELQINEQGVITNWPKHPDLDAFFNEQE